MADIRCPQCGKNNPDFLDVCQFCQSPLQSESMLHIGEKPTKKDTGDLEGVLPDWLKNARQQARDSAQEEAAHVAAQPKVQKEEPVDLLAGLFQSDASDDEDVPDWLSSINQNVKGKPPVGAPPVQPEPETDFFAQFNKSDVAPKTEAPPAIPSAPQNEPLQPPDDAAERDELSAWFAEASDQPVDTFAVDRDASQASSDWGIDSQEPFQAEPTPAPKEEEDLSWLHNLESSAKQTNELNAARLTRDWERDFGTPAQGSDQEDLSWLNNLGSLPGTEQTPAQPAQLFAPQEDQGWLDSLGGASSPAPSDKSDEDLGWLNKLGGTPIEQPPVQPAQPQEDLSWLNSFKGTPEPSQPAVPSPSSSDDLSWLNNLGAAPADPPAIQPSKPQEDLSWLNSFSESSQAPEPAPASSPEDLGWLNNLGAIPVEQTPSQPEQPQEDLSRLNAFSDSAESSPPMAAPPSSRDDLDWLNAIGSTSAKPPSQPSTQDDMSWLNSLQGGEPEPLSSAPFDEPVLDQPVTDIPHVSPFVPRKTAPLEEGSEASIPDWLKSAAEGPSMPMGTSGLEQFREDYRVPTQPEEPFSWKSFTKDATPAEEPASLSSSLPEDKPEPVSVDPSLFSTGSSASIPSAEDVNSLFSIDMPDWLSQAEPTKEEDSAQPIGIHAEDGDALAPVDLPSWVQAMRPVDAVIADTAPSIDDQPTEREGPLAGFRGLIPVMPIGSTRRPKPISLKLQATDEQQASAAILEQLLASETSPRPLMSAPTYAPQRTLRQVLTVVFLLVLSAVIFMRSQMFPISPAPALTAGDISNRLQGIPEGANVLVVMDYEPALSGELEAVSGPLLDQLVVLRHPKLTFVSTSPNGPALVERLMLNTNLYDPNSNGGVVYSPGQNYFNLGFLPGAESGVLTFMQSPKVAFPNATVDGFSEYAAVLVLTDNANSARIWIEQLQNVKQADSALALQPLLVASSAQAGPMLQPYVSSRQINGLVAGLADAARFEFGNNTGRPGIARSYWDAFGVGLIMAVALIVLGSLWSIFAGIRARRAEVAEG
jgi:hypothetical protein